MKFATACGFFSCESPIEKERRELQEATESSEAVLYRGLKVALRSAPLDGSETDAKSTKIRQLTASVFAKILRESDKAEQTVELTPADYAVGAQPAVLVGAAVLVASALVATLLPAGRATTRG